MYNIGDLCDLDLYPFDLTITGRLKETRTPYHTWIDLHWMSFKSLTSPKKSWNHQNMSNMYNIGDLCDPDLWPFDLKLRGRWEDTSILYDTWLDFHWATSWGVSYLASARNHEKRWYLCFISDLCDLHLWPFDLIVTGRQVDNSTLYHTWLDIHWASGGGVRYLASGQNHQQMWYLGIISDLCDLDLRPFDLTVTGRWEDTSTLYHTRLDLH